MIRIEPSPLESSRFGVAFSRLIGTALEAEPLRQALAEADQTGSLVISCRVNAIDLAQVSLLEDAGFRLMDTLVYYRRSLAEGSPIHIQSENHDIVRLTAGDAADCAEIARLAFRSYLGHYHADPRLADTAADDAYADWAGRLLLAPTEQQIALGASVADHIVGFLIARMRADGEMEIVLNAVRPDEQRTGRYGAMLRRYIHESRDRGVPAVVTSTQLQNYAVQRVWTKHGFLPFQSFHTLHRWSPYCD